MDKALGLAIARQGRSREALPHYQRALKLNPRSSTAHLNLGLALEQLGQQAEARKQYEAVLKSAPNHHEAQLRLRALSTTGPIKSER